MQADTSKMSGFWFRPSDYYDHKIRKNEKGTSLGLKSAVTRYFGVDFPDLNTFKSFFTLSLIGALMPLFLSVKAWLVLSHNYHFTLLRLKFLAFTVMHQLVFWHIQRVTDISTFHILNATKLSFFSLHIVTLLKGHMSMNQQAKAIISDLNCKFA